MTSDGDEANADSRSPTISGDGRFVAFQSKASNLVPGDGLDFQEEAFVREPLV